MEQIFRLYHAIDTQSMVIPGLSEQAWTSGDKELSFVLVAEVQTKELDDVFTLTNHGAMRDPETDEEKAWPTNEGVRWFNSLAKLRSTSVGDVAVDQTTKQVWLCIPFGWKEIK